MAGDGNEAVQGLRGADVAQPEGHAPIMGPEANLWSNLPREAFRRGVSHCSRNQPLPNQMTAEELLTRALHAIKRSGTEYDTSGTGAKRERSAARIAQLFAQHAGIILTKEQVWCFMQCVKLARLEATPNHEDSLVDLLAYRVLELEELSGGGQP
jgi:hypothetical protein